jgi:hypothetical protein
METHTVRHESVNKLLADIRKPTQEQPASPPPPPIDDDEIDNDLDDPDDDDDDKPKGKGNDDLLSKEALEAGADVTIGLFDITQAKTFQILGEAKKKRKLKKRFGPDAVDKAQDLIDEADLNAENKIKSQRTLTNEEWGMLRLERAAREYLEDMPLSEAEKNNLKIPLMTIMKQHGGAIPPHYLLMFGLLQVVGSRAAQLAML